MYNIVRLRANFDNEVVMSTSQVLDEIRARVGTANPHLRQALEALENISVERGKMYHLTTLDADGRPQNQLEFGMSKYAYLLRQYGVEVNVPIQLDMIPHRGATTHPRDTAIAATIAGLMRALRWEGQKNFQITVV